MLTRVQIVKWAKELRNPKYEQGHNFLVAGDKLCCMGVYLVGVEGIDPADLFVGLPSNIRDNYSQDVGINKEVGKNFALAIKSYTNSLRFGQPVCGETMFGYLNDSLKWSFAKIADFIETLPASDDEENKITNKEYNV